MKKLRSKIAWLNIFCTCFALGCSPTQPFFLHDDGDFSHYLDAATEISYPDVEQTTLPDVTEAEAPLTTENTDVKERWKMTLEEAISIAFQNAHNLRTLGARVFTPVGQTAGSPPESLSLNPDFAPSAYDVAIQETSNTGPEAALANFDAQLQSRFTWDRSDRPQNVLPDRTNVFQPTLDRDNINYQTELSKRTASGTQWFFRNVTQYDSTNNPRTAQFDGDPNGIRALYSEWLTSIEMEVRHPLLRNSGVQVNRIPVMLARINTDVAINDFEINVASFIFEIEQAYWNLYFHYHNLDAARTGAASALATWKQTKTRRDKEIERGEAANEAQARAQYFAFKSRLQQAKSDLLHQENKLRFMLGLSATDGRLIQPVDQPTKARVEFAWEEIKHEALVRSPVLRRQKWRIKQQQLQLMAARNQLLPQFDAIALYRFLGQGDNLGRFGSRSGLNFPDDESNALDNLFENDNGEWQLGFQYQMPIGFRAELAQVRNQQLQLRRAEKRLEDQELEVSHQLTAAVRRLRDQYQIAQTQYNTLKAYRDQVKASQTAFEKAQSVPIDVVLDAQSRQAQAEIDYFRALAEYNLAIAEVHMRKGSIMEYNGVALAEGPWPSKAYFDAQRRARQRDSSYYLNYGFTRPGVVSRGAVKDFMGTPATAIETSSVITPVAIEHDDDGLDAIGSEIISHFSSPPATPSTSTMRQQNAQNVAADDKGYPYGSLGL